MKYRACIFDFDLTLADSTQGILICFRHTLAKFGYEVPDDRTIFNTIGMPLIDALDFLSGVPMNPRRQEMFNEYVHKADDEMVKGTYFYDGAIELLDGLRAKGVKVGICSSKLKFRIEESFAVKADHMPVDLIVGLGEVPNPKPAPDSLDLCMEKLGVKACETLYVGDNLIDAQTAQNAATDFVAVLTGSTSREEFEKLPHKFICRKLSDLAKFVNVS